MFAEKLPSFIQTTGDQSNHKDDDQSSHGPANMASVHVGRILTEVFSHNPAARTPGFKNQLVMLFDFYIGVVDH